MRSPDRKIDVGFHQPATARPAGSTTRLEWPYFRTVLRFGVGLTVASFDPYEVPCQRVRSASDQWLEFGGHGPAKSAEYILVGAIDSL
jgi:hypothetical protein